jgi:Ca2+-binding EF-hand superfamily protein
MAAMRMKSSVPMGCDDDDVFKSVGKDEIEEMGWNPKIKQSTAQLLMGLKRQLKKRGANGIAGIARKFRIMDDDNSGSLDIDEFTKAMKETKMKWTPAEVKEVFDYFDDDKSGDIKYDEFLVGVRGEMNKRRAQLVLLAFDIMDKDKSGAITIEDIASLFDASQADDVKAGKKTEDEILKEFLDNFDQAGEDGTKDGKVTPDEWCKYYSNVSASVDEDDYFELMIRNAWHISGGEGWCANTTNRRVLVTHPDGRQTVEEVKNDLGIKAGDEEAMIANLKAQGIDVDSMETVGKMDDDTGPQPPAVPAGIEKKRAAAANKKLGDSSVPF